MKTENIKIKGSLRLSGVHIYLHHALRTKDESGLLSEQRRGSTPHLRLRPQTIVKLENRGGG